MKLQQNTEALQRRHEQRVKQAYAKMQQQAHLLEENKDDKDTSSSDEEEEMKFNPQWQDNRLQLLKLRSEVRIDETKHTDIFGKLLSEFARRPDLDENECPLIF